MDTVLYTYMPLPHKSTAWLETMPDVDPATHRFNVALVGLDDTLAFAAWVFTWYPGVGCILGDSVVCYSIEQLKWSLLVQREPCRLVFSFS